MVSSVAWKRRKSFEIFRCVETQEDQARLSLRCVQTQEPQASVAEPSAACKRRRASSTETKQVKGMLPLRLFSQEALRCVSAQEDSPCELPQFGVRWCLSAMASVACMRRRPLRCVYAQEDFPLRVSAGICRPSVACQRRRCLLANDQ